MSSARRTIRMQGTGTATAECDEAVISGGVKVKKPSVVEASQLASVASKDVHEALLEVNGVTARDVATTNISVHTEFDYGPGGRQGPPSYAVSQGLTLRLRGATGDTVASAINAMVTAAGDSLQLNSVSFALSEPVRVQLLEQARKVAAADATEKANLYAQELGMRVGDVLEVWEEDGRRPSPRPMAHGGGEMAAGKMMAADASFGGQVNIGDSAITASVWVMFELLES